MKLGEYKQKWYDKFDIKVVRSKRHHEGYDGKELDHYELGFFVWTPKSSDLTEHILKRYVSELIRLIEKTVVLYGYLYDFCDDIRNDGVLKEVNVGELISRFTKIHTEEWLDLNIKKKSMECYDCNKSIVFQVRIPWELGIDLENRKFYVYGRFNSTVV